jgi:hypothetical protein
MSVPSHKVTFDSDPKVRKITVDGEGRPELNGEDILTCGSTVPGFCFSNKQWCWFRVDHLEEVAFNSEAFHTLLLPEDQKATIKSLVTVHANGDEGFDDIIKGKGKGMIFLLHGVPGVGKTLTAGEDAPEYKHIEALLTLEKKALRTSQNAPCTLSAPVTLALMHTQWRKSCPWRYRLQPLGKPSYSSTRRMSSLQSAATLICRGTASFQVSDHDR